MIPLKLRIKNIGPYKDESADLAGIPGDLVAICGLNGEGKTMMMESIFAGMYRNFPSRDTLYRYCTDRHAGIEYVFEMAGKIYSSFINIDSKARKMEAVISCDGTPLNDGLVGTFDDQIRMILGSEAQALASAYGAQNKKGNFVELDKSRRKDLFITMIGADLLDKISVKAKSLGDSLESEKASLDGKLTVLRSMANREAPHLSTITGAIEQESAKIDEINRQINTLHAEVAVAAEKIKGIPALQNEKHVHEDAVQEHAQAILSITREIESIQSLISTIPQLQDDIRKEVALADERKAKAAVLRDKCSHVDHLTDAVTNARNKAGAIQRSRDTIRASLREQTLLAEHLPAIREKAEELSALRKEEADLGPRLRQLNSDVLVATQSDAEYTKVIGELRFKMDKINAEEASVRSKIEQAAKGKEFLGSVPCGGMGKYSECKFLKEAIMASSTIDDLSSAVDNLKIASLSTQQEIDSIPKTDREHMSRLMGEIKRLNARTAELRGRIAEFEKATARLSEAESANSSMVLLKASLATADQSLDEAKQEESNSAALLSSAVGAKHELESVTKETSLIVKRIEDLASRLKAAEGSEDKIQRLISDSHRDTTDKLEAEKRIEQIVNELSALDRVALEHNNNSRKLDELTGIIKPTAEKSLKEFEHKLAQAQEEIRAITEAKGQAETIDRMLESVNYKMACYARVAKTFGPMEIQSFEIDAAGPEVSRIANDLLFNCFGPRFSVKFVTQELKADGKGFKDEFDVSVYDQRHDRWVGIDDLSGGEKVIVSESLALSIALFNREKNGIAWETLFRDEVSGALDDLHAPQYVKMLRAAKEMGHFKRVFFISHQGRMKEMADARIVISGGKMIVES